MKFRVESIIFPVMNMQVKSELYSLSKSENELSVNTEIGSKSVQSKENGNEYEVMLTVKLHDKNDMLLIHVVCVGRFAFDEPESENALDYVLNVNCNAMLYPYLREKVTYLSVSAGLPPVILEPFNFIKRYNDIKAQKKESEKSKTKSN